MRFVAPPRSAIDPDVFRRPPLAQWLEYRDLLCASEWPPVDTLNLSARRAGDACLPRFVRQLPALLADGLHYEQRIAERGAIATRENNWHDLLNALVWLRFPRLKAALNTRQVAQIAIAGPKARTRAQCALTLFDEAGVIVVLRDPALLALWDTHDWHGLFWRERAAWSDGRIDAVVFGHALLEHALKRRQLLVGKALVIAVPQSIQMDNAAVTRWAAIEAIARSIAVAQLLLDPQELRPLPVSGIPGWHEDNGAEAFYYSAPCFCALRAGRCYPEPLSFRRLDAPGQEIAEQVPFHAVAPAGAVVAGDAEATAVTSPMIAENQ